MNYLTTKTNSTSFYKIIEEIKTDTFTAYRCHNTILRECIIFNIQTKKEKDEIRQLISKQTEKINEDDIMMGNFRVITESEYYKIIKENNESN